MDDIEFKKKYLKYKLKYLNLKMLGGSLSTPKVTKSDGKLFTPDEKREASTTEFNFNRLFEPDTNTDQKLDSLKELCHFYYHMSKHRTQPTIDLIELLSDMRHDMSSSDRKTRIDDGKYNKQFSSETLLDTYIEYLNDYYNQVFSEEENKEIYEAFDIPFTIDNFDLKELCEKVTDDESIKIDSNEPSRISLQGQIRRWNTSEETYILCGTPINTFTKTPFLLTKDTGAAEGIIGKNAMLSELDGLKHIISKEDYKAKNHKHYTGDEPFFELLGSLEGTNGRNFLYQEIMEFYFNKNIKTLKLDIIFPNLQKKEDKDGNEYLNIKIDYRRISTSFGEYNWYVTFGYKLNLDDEVPKYYEFIVDVTGRGSTQNCYNLKDLELRYRIGSSGKYNPDKETPAMLVGDFIEKIEDQNESTNFLCIINILCGLLLKASGDDTQQALNFALTNYIIVKEYIISDINIEEIEKLESSIITHDRQLLRRLLDKLLVIYKLFFYKIKEQYNHYIDRIELLESKIENSVTYRTANKHIKKNLLGLCQKVYLDNDFPKYNYFKFHLENRSNPTEVDIARRFNIIKYYFLLFLYIISTNNEHLDFCKRQLIKLSKIKFDNYRLNLKNLKKYIIEEIINEYKTRFPFVNAIQRDFMGIKDIVNKREISTKYNDIVIKYVIELINGKYVNFITIVGDSFSLPNIQIAEIMKSHDNILYILCENINLKIPYNNHNKQKFKIQMLSESISDTKIVDDYENWEELRENISGISREYYMEFVKYSYEKIIWKIFTINNDIIEQDVTTYINYIINNCIRLNTSRHDLEDFDEYENASKTADGPTMLLRKQKELIKELIYTISIFARLAPNK